MELVDAAERMDALAHPARLKLLRALLANGGDGLAAGALAARLGVAPSTLSAQLKALTAAGLAHGRREGRSIRYSADAAALGELVVFLLQGLGGGRREVAGPAARAVLEALSPG